MDSTQSNSDIKGERGKGEGESSDQARSLAAWGNDLSGLDVWLVEEDMILVKRNMLIVYGKDYSLICIKLMWHNVIGGCKIGVLHHI